MLEPGATNRPLPRQPDRCAWSMLGSLASCLQRHMHSGCEETYRATESVHDPRFDGGADPGHPAVRVRSPPHLARGSSGPAEGAGVPIACGQRGPRRGRSVRAAPRRRPSGSDPGGFAHDRAATFTATVPARQSIDLTPVTPRSAPPSDGQDPERQTDPWMPASHGSVCFASVTRHRVRRDLPTTPFHRGSSLPLARPASESEGHHGPYPRGARCVQMERIL